MDFEFVFSIAYCVIRIRRVKIKPKITDNTTQQISKARTEIIQSKIEEKYEIII